MTEIDREVLLRAGREYLDRWSRFLRENPDISGELVEAALKAGGPPPEPLPPEFGIKTAIFDESPLAIIYYNVRNELRLRDPGERSRPFHHRVAIWAAWESHKTARDKKTGATLLELVGLPDTYRGLAKLLGVSTRTLRSYRETYGEFARTGQSLTFNRILSRYRLDAVDALGTVATDPGHSQFAQSQRTYFTMTGDLVDRSDITSDGERVPPPVIYLPKNGRDGGD